MPAFMKNQGDCTPAIESRRGRLGQLAEVAVLPFAGADAGCDRTGLRLTASGRIRNSAGATLYTVWRILNSSDRTHTVTLYAPQVTGRLDTSYRIELTLPPRTESIVRSPVVAWPAMHLLSEGVRLIDAKHASPDVYDS
jgi:hypothetical protein